MMFWRQVKKKTDMNKIKTSRNFVRYNNTHYTMLKRKILC